MKVLCLPAFAQCSQIMSFRAAAHKAMKGMSSVDAIVQRNKIRGCFTQSTHTIDNFFISYN